MIYNKLFFYVFLILLLNLKTKNMDIDSIRMVEVDVNEFDKNFKKKPRM